MNSIPGKYLSNFARVIVSTFMLVSLAALTVLAADRGDDNRNKRCGDQRGSDKRNNSGRLDVVGITADQRLICFDEKHPAKTKTIGFVFGLIVDTSLVGIDFRPASGADGDEGDLYGLGNAGGVYTLSLDTAEATFKSRLNVALSGNSFGVDFNPVVDRLRIVSDNGQNLRANVDTGATIVDTALNYTPGTPASGITGAAYTNNDADSNTATTLYNIDSILNQVNIQAPPNAGTLNTTGKLTIVTTPVIGFDIYSTIRNGSTVDVRGLASFETGGQARFYRITLFTGKAELSGTFSSQDQVTDIAIPLNQL